MSWSSQIVPLGGGCRIRILSDRQPVAVGDYYRLLADSSRFRSWYGALLRDSGFDAFFWEHPRAGPNSLASPAEFVLLDAPSLATVAPDALAFAGIFERNPGRPVVSFPNLGGDAMLVAPAPAARDDGYPHLARFIRSAAPELQDALWQTCGELAQELVARQPFWLSTSGLGVPWLHVRFDWIPKYYQHQPYRRVDPYPV